ncbi:MAG: sulfatase [Candidatus Hydrogenedentes bacterium]|nr:sulfatase [Candidatus Hydrogenedentota bacterium]
MSGLPRFALCSLVLLGAVSHHAAGAPPNVLLITSEDNGPELGCYGDPFARTPNLDTLAEAGVRFDRAFVVTASCSESRSALLTGLFPHQNGQIGLATHQYRQFPEVPNIVALLKGAGYRTGLIGKLHVNPESAFPFDFRLGSRIANSFSSRDVRQVAEGAAEFFRAGQGPFLLMVNFADAHLPYLRESHGLPENPISGDAVAMLPWVGLETPALRDAQADYYNCLSRLDTGIGLLLQALASAGRDSDTLVIYLGDHGAQFPRGKLASYDSALRVPLLIRWPGVSKSGLTRDELTSSLDIAATILDAAGIDSSTPLAGRSLRPLLRGELYPWREYLVTEYHGHYPPLYFPQRTIRDARYKLIGNLLRDRPNPIAHAFTQLDPPTQRTYATPAIIGAAPEPVREAYATWLDAPPIELYDLANDPHEWNNRAGDPALAPVKARLLDALAAWQKETADPLADPAILEQLTREHDAVPTPYTRNPDHEWRYPEYLDMRKKAARR